MSETISIGIQRDFVISGDLSGHAFRTAMNIDHIGARLLYLALRSYERSRQVERQLDSALNNLDEAINSVRRDIQKTLRRRSSGMPSGRKRTLVIRSMISARAYSVAVKVDQVQNDLIELSMAGATKAFSSGQAASDRITKALRGLDEEVTSITATLDGQAKKKVKQARAVQPKSEGNAAPKSRPVKSETPKASTTPEQNDQKAKKPPAMAAKNAPAKKKKSSSSPDTESDSSTAADQKSKKVVQAKKPVSTEVAGPVLFTQSATKKAIPSSSKANGDDDSTLGSSALKTSKTGTDE